MDAGVHFTLPDLRNQGRAVDGIHLDDTSAGNALQGVLMKIMNKAVEWIFSPYSRTLLVPCAVFALAVSGFMVKPADAQGGRVIRVSNMATAGGVESQVEIAIRLSSQGDEASTSFSLQFNPVVLTNPSVARGPDVPLDRISR